MTLTAGHSRDGAAQVEAAPGQSARWRLQWRWQSGSWNFRHHEPLLAAVARFVSVLGKSWITSPLGPPFE